MRGGKSMIFKMGRIRGKKFNEYVNYYLKKRLWIIIIIDNKKAYNYVKTRVENYKHKNRKIENK